MLSDLHHCQKYQHKQYFTADKTQERFKTISKQYGCFTVNLNY